MAGVGAAFSHPALPVRPADLGGAAAEAIVGGPAPAGAPRPSASGTPAAPPSPVTAPPTPAATRAVSRNERLENEVTALVNVERAKQGCGPVRPDTKLRTAARGHSADMATNDYFSHTGRDGSTPWDRARRAGYAEASGENIAYGYPTAADVTKGWMNSPGHRANILNCSSKATGVGLAYQGRTAYWTQLFGRA